MTITTIGRRCRWALVSPDGVAPIRMVGVSASANLPLHHKLQKFSSGTGSPGWSRKKGRKTVVVVVQRREVGLRCFKRDNAASTAVVRRRRIVNYHRVSLGTRNREEVATPRRSTVPVPSSLCPFRFFTAGAAEPSSSSSSRRVIDGRV